jgi:hypothetical protein
LKRSVHTDRRWLRRSFYDRLETTDPVGVVSRRRWRASSTTGSWWLRRSFYDRLETTHVPLVRVGA